MPCRCDHLEPTAREAKSKKVAGFLVYLANKIGIKIDEETKTIANSTYGNADKADIYSAVLCLAILRLNAKQLDLVVYKGKDAKARELASWWDEHKEKDVIREEQENIMRRAQEFRKTGLAKLTPEEREALGVKNG